MTTVEELMGRKLTPKESDSLNGSLNKILNPFPSTCEYEHRNETRALASHTTDPTQYTLDVHYTCGCYYCAHPERECRTRSQPFWKPCRIYWQIVAPVCGGQLLHCATAFGYKKHEQGGGSG